METKTLRCGDRKIRKILFSTDTGMTESGIFLIYHSMFQIEFLYRDAKQNTGLEHWQSTDSDRIHEAIGRWLSVASVKRVLHNTSLYQHIRKFIEGRKSGDLKNNNSLTEEIPYDLLFFGVRDSA